MRLKYHQIGLLFPVIFSAPVLYAADVICDKTLYYCGASPGDNVFITTTVKGSTTPSLAGYGIYINSSKYNLNDITISTSGSQADAIFSNGNNGGNIFSTGTVSIKTTGDSADGINLGVRGGNGNENYTSLNIAHLGGANGEISAQGIAVRANNGITENSKSVIIIGDGYTIKQTGTDADNGTDGRGYAVYAGNRDQDISGYGGWDAISGKRNNNKGQSYVFIGDNANISSIAQSNSSYKAAAVYANKGGIIQLGNNSTISAPSNAYYLFASTEKQNKGNNHANETAEERPGTILLKGGLRFDDVTSINQVVMHSKGKNSLIKSGYMDYEVDVNHFNIDPNVHDSSGVFLIGGNLLASEGGTIDLKMDNGSIFNGMTQRADQQSNIYLSLDGASSKWQFSESSSLTELLIKNAARLEVERNSANPNLVLTGNVSSQNGVIDLFDQKSPLDQYKVTNFTIQGNYIGDHGTLILGTELAGDASKTDKLIIHGAATGSTELIVKNIGGEGHQTIDGIHVIQTQTSAKDAFYIANGGYVAAGAYDYGLFLENENTGDNWYLKSHLRDDEDISVYTPDVGSYLAAEVMGNTLFTSRLEDREGASGFQNLEKDNGSIWIRAYGGRNKFNSMSQQLETKGSSVVTQMGAGLASLGEDNQYNLGVMGGYAYYNGKTTSVLTDRTSNISIDGYSLGLYATWFAHPVEKHGTYVDSWVLWNSFNNKIDTADKHNYKYDSSGVTASIEVGGDYLLNKNGQKNWWLQPQSQLIYQGVHADHFTDAQGVNIEHGSDNLQARLGLKTYLEIPSTVAALTHYRPYIALNYIHNTNPYAVNIDNTEYTSQGSANLAEVKVGVEGHITKNSQLWLNAAYVAGGHDNQTYQGNIGWKYNF